MRVSDFHFDLPEELIAQHPPAERGSSRMLVLDRAKAGNREQGTGHGAREVGSREEPAEAGLTDAWFRDLPGFLRAGDLLILNDSRVLPARLFATRGGLTTQAGSPEPSGMIEVLLTQEVGSDLDPTFHSDPASQRRDLGPLIRWRALVKPARKVRVGEILNFAAGVGESQAVLTAEVVGAGEFGERTLRFAPVGDFYARVERIGHVPLPPYIRREQAGRVDTAEDRERYQTVYSHQPGSAAAPTAGLHFTPEILAELKVRGVEIQYVTLHVGLGTFQPVRVSQLRDIRLHAERYTLPEATAEALNRAVREGRRVIAVGTTTTRTLEHIAAEAVGPGAKAVMPELKSRPVSEAHDSRARGSACLEAHSGSTSIFLGPGHKFRIVNGLLTNFHLPASTLVMLVSAFAAPEGEPDWGRRTVLAAYEHAIRERYRFYSYGDCMLVV